jgi:hypothetical protein
MRGSAVSLLLWRDTEKQQYEKWEHKHESMSIKCGIFVMTESGGAIVVASCERQSV